MVRYTKSMPKYTKIWLDMAYMLSSKKQTFAYENRPMRISSFLISYFSIFSYLLNPLWHGVSEKRFVTGGTLSDI